MSLSPQVLYLPVDVPASWCFQGCRDGLHQLRVHQPLHQCQHHPEHLHPLLSGSNITAPPWSKNNCNNQTDQDEPLKMIVHILRALSHCHLLLNVLLCSSPAGDPENLQQTEQRLPHLPPVQLWERADGAHQEWHGGPDSQWVRDRRL